MLNVSCSVAIFFRNLSNDTIQYEFTYNSHIANYFTFYIDSYKVAGTVVHPGLYISKEVAMNQCD